MAEISKRTSNLIVHEQPHSFVSKQFKRIRSNIMFTDNDEPIKSIVVTSDEAKAGKSTIAANIAVAYAQAGYKTLIIDGDMRKPTLHYIFNLSNEDGLTTVLFNNNSLNGAIQQAEETNLDILTSGPIPNNPSELITSSAFSTLYNKLLSEYSFIVIDTPSVNLVTDAQLFSKYTNHVLYVVNSEKNNKEDVLRGKKLIEATGAIIIGVVINKSTNEKKSNHYKYYGNDPS